MLRGSATARVSSAAYCFRLDESQFPVLSATLIFSKRYVNLARAHDTEGLDLPKKRVTPT